MSSPDKRVFVSDGEGKNFIYATASCQGWRRDQEDAEECIPYFDENASLFILCDGHGGAEVAKYTVEHLPDFIKNHPLYKEGKYEEALETAFIEFDAILRTEKVNQELHRLAFEDNSPTKKKLKKDSETLDEEPSGSAGPSSSNNDNGIVEDVDADTLRREAQLPLSSILEKYPAILALAEQSRSSRVNASPVIRAPRDEENGATSSNQPGGSASTVSEPTQGPSNLNTPVKSDSNDVETSKPLVTSWPAEEQNESSDSEGSDFFLKGESSSDEDDDENEDGDDEDDNEAGEGTSSGPKKLRRKKHKRPLDDDSDTSSSDDDADDDDDDDDDEEDDENEDDSEDDEEAGDEEKDWDDEEGLTIDQLQSLLPKSGMRESGSRQHCPGLDSGCTVVVALVKDGKIYVASAGDSRCILVMRNGECKPMSFDHKPEDSIERKRIVRAGGKVTEGRVNGGLNLSRALGDFTYKNPELDAKEQMITAWPDVKTADLDPKEVEYIFLACDGIWNSMKNQQAAKFIRKSAPTSKKDLVKLCVQLFRGCIAPRTDGDGTGCDNMTCIIAKYGTSSSENSTNNDLKKEVDEGQEDGEGEEEEQEAEVDGDDATSSHKRSTSDDNETDDMPTTKRRCLRL